MIDPKHFKEEWLKIDNPNEWCQFNESELEKSPISKATKDFLKIGFPESAPPFLGFGWKSYDWKFHNIKGYYDRYGYDLEGEKSNYWIFGSENNGDPICFDISNGDQIVILDHEQEFDFRETMNKSIYELAECLIAYRNFVKTVIKENGDSAFLDANFTDDQFEVLANSFRKIDKNILEVGSYWGTEINGLIGEREFYKKK